MESFVLSLHATYLTRGHKFPRESRSLSVRKFEVLVCVKCLSSGHRESSLKLCPSGLHRGDIMRGMQPYEKIHKKTTIHAQYACVQVLRWSLTEILILHVKRSIEQFAFHRIVWGSVVSVEASGKGFLMKSSVWGKKNKRANTISFC